MSGLLTVEQIAGQSKKTLRKCNLLKEDLSRRTEKSNNKSKHLGISELVTDDGRVDENDKVDNDCDCML